MLSNKVKAKIKLSYIGKSQISLYNLIWDKYNKWIVKILIIINGIFNQTFKDTFRKLLLCTIWISRKIF